MDVCAHIFTCHLYVLWRLSYASFKVIRHESVEQLLLLGRMLQGTIKSPSHFSQHPAAVGTFFTAMLLGFKFCSCQTQGNLENCRTGLSLLEDRVYRWIHLLKSNTQLFVDSVNWMGSWLLSLLSKHLGNSISHAHFNMIYNKLQFWVFMSVHVKNWLE